MREIALRKEFGRHAQYKRHPDLYYKRYLHAVCIAKFLNTQITSGKLLIAEYGSRKLELTKFKFYKDGKPCIYQTIDNVNWIWFGGTLDSEGRTIIEQTFPEIFNIFRSVIILDLKKGKRIPVKYVRPNNANSHS